MIVQRRETQSSTPDADEVPDQLVEEGRVEGRAVEVLERPVRGRDLEPPRQLGRLAVELLVPPVADAADPLREQEARRGRVHELRDAVRPRGARRSRRRSSPKRIAAPDAEAALPHLEDALPLRARHFVPRGDVVVERARRSTPNATPHTATRVTRSQSPPIAFQRTPVSQMHAMIATSSVSPYMWSCSGPEMDDAGVRRGDVAEHGQGFCPFEAGRGC